MQHARTQALFHACTQVGGFEAYLLADEEKEGAAAAEVYRQVGVILVDVCVCVCVCVCGAFQGPGVDVGAGLKMWGGCGIHIVSTAYSFLLRRMCVLQVLACLWLVAVQRQARTSNTHTPTHIHTHKARTCKKCPCS